MDPLSMTASIIAILQLTTTLTNYINDVRRATKEQAAVAVEASNLYGLLTSLRFRIEAAQDGDPWFGQVKTLGMENGPLDQFNSMLQKVVDPISPARKRGLIKSAVTWTFTKTEVDKLLGQIERIKSLINWAQTKTADRGPYSQCTKTTGLSSAVDRYLAGSPNAKEALGGTPNARCLLRIDVRLQRRGDSTTKTRLQWLQNGQLNIGNSLVEVVSMHTVNMHDADFVARRQAQ